MSINIPMPEEIKVNENDSNAVISANAQTLGNGLLKEEHPLLGVGQEKQDAENIKQLLFDHADSLVTYAVIDGAKNKGTPVFLDGFDAMHTCLFRGEAKKKFGEAAPYLVQLTEDAKCLEWVIESCIKHQAVLFLQSSYTMDELYHHLRRFTYVQQPESNTPLFFRFYDSGCFATYVQELTEERLSIFLRNIPRSLGCTQLDLFSDPCITSFTKPLTQPTMSEPELVHVGN